MSTLESRIDDLYKLPLAEFVSARSALAKSLTGAEAERVRKLAKPTLVPWAINQVYWQAPSIYERVLKSGERLRNAQVAALEGRKGEKSDLRSATEAHQRAVADAVRQAERFAAASGSRPIVDELRRTFEALALGSQRSELHPAGRLVRPLALAGFEALAGVRLKVKPAHAQQEERAPHVPMTSKKEVAAQKRRDAALKKKREAVLQEVRRAEAEVERARRRMLEAQEKLRRTRDQVS